MQEEEEGEKIQDKVPERPLECGECRKPVMIHYTEVVGDLLVTTCMCSACPELQKRLHGTTGMKSGSSQALAVAGLVCGNCGTSLEAVRVGAPLGCNVCYDVFGDLLLHELLAADKVPQRLTNAKKSAPIHIGRSPGETQEINPALRLLALNEALSETLKKEDYEQAAWIRDQINELTDNSDKNEGQTKKGKKDAGK